MLTTSAILRRRLFLAEIADIFVIQIHIHEAAQLPFVGKQMLAQLAEFNRQLAERFANGPRWKLRRIAFCRKYSQRRGNNHLTGIYSPSLS